MYYSNSPISSKNQKPYQISPLHSKMLFFDHDTEITRLNNQIIILNGVNLSKENYIKELEDKLNNISKKSDPTQMGIILKEQKKLFDQKEQKWLKEKENLKQKFEESENGRDSLKNLELEKNVLESSLKIHKISINELETKIDVLNRENYKLNNFLQIKQKEHDEELSILEYKLQEQFDFQRKQIELKLEKILNENEKLINFNNNLLNDNEKIQINLENMQKKHEILIEETKNTFINQSKTQYEELKIKMENEQKVLESKFLRQKEYSIEIEKKLTESMQENAVLRADFVEKQGLIEELENKYGFYQKKFEEEQKNIKLMNEIIEKNDQIQLKFNTLQSENLKISDLLDKTTKEKEILRLKHEKLSENFSQLMEESQKQKELQKNKSEESAKKRAKSLDTENTLLKSQIEIYEAEKKSFEDKQKALLEENSRLNNLFTNQNEIDLKTKNLKENIIILLNENSKLNEIMDSSTQTGELWRVKYEALQQDFEQRVNEIKIRNKTEIEGLNNIIEKLQNEIYEANRIQNSLGNTLNQCYVANNSQNNEMGTYKANLHNQAQYINDLKLENERLIINIKKLEENHNIQLKELYENVRGHEFALSQQELIKSQYESELNIHKNSLKEARNSLLQCHNVLSYQLKDRYETEYYEKLTIEQLKRNLSETEETITQMKKAIIARDNKIVELNERIFYTMSTEEELKIKLEETMLEKEEKKELESVLESIKGEYNGFKIEQSYFIDNLRERIKVMENEIWHLRNEREILIKKNKENDNIILQFNQIQNENFRLKQQQLHFNGERKILGNIENRRFSAKRERSNSKNCDNSFGLINENERINAQILKRCREIVGKI